MNRIHRCKSMLWVLAIICPLACAAGGDKGSGGGGEGGDDTWANSASGSGSTSTGSSSSSGGSSCNTTHTDCTDCYYCTIEPGTGPCFTARDNCNKDSACVAYDDCIDACNDNVPCMNECGVNYPQGKAKYDIGRSCYCAECADSCGTLSVCTW